MLYFVFFYRWSFQAWALLAWRVSYGCTKGFLKNFNDIFPLCFKCVIFNVILWPRRWDYAFGFILWLVFWVVKSENFILRLHVSTWCKMISLPLNARRVLQKIHACWFFHCLHVWPRFLSLHQHVSTWCKMISFPFIALRVLQRIQACWFFICDQPICFLHMFISLTEFGKPFDQ